MLGGGLFFSCFFGGFGSWGFGGFWGVNNLDAGARDGFAREEGFLSFGETHDAGFFGVDGEVAGHIGAEAGNLSSAGLADDNFASVDFLAAKALDAEALTGVVVDVFACAACFDVCHVVICSLKQ